VDLDESLNTYVSGNPFKRGMELRIYFNLNFGDITGFSTLQNCDVSPTYR
jgi:hypothetical protein